MELQIQDLVTSIRKEGIDAANEQAEQIIADAKAKAAKIIEDAKAEAQATSEKAARDIEVLRQGAIQNADQAKRDAVIAFKKDVAAELHRILHAEVKKELSGDALAKLIKAVIVEADISEYALEVQDVSDALKKTLDEEILHGLEVRPVRSMSAGFRLAAKDGSGYIDCTDDEIMQLLMPYFRDMNF